MYESKAQLMVTAIVLRKDVQIPVDIVDQMVRDIREALEVAYEHGQLDAVQTLFPESFDDYYGDAPLREAAMKLVLGKK